MATNLSKEYIVINETVKQKIKIQYRLKCPKNKIVKIQRMLK